MQRRKERQGEDGPVMSRFECALAPEITVMAASGLWQDLRDGLDQAELICSDLPGNRRPAVWCAGQRLSSLELADLPWRYPRRGGEEP